MEILESWTFYAQVFLHTYLNEGMEIEEFKEAESNLQDLVAEYQNYEVGLMYLCPFNFRLPLVSAPFIFRPFNFRPLLNWQKFQYKNPKFAPFYFAPPQF